MAKVLVVRIASAAGLLALALLFVGAVPFLDAGANSSGMTPPVSVNRTLKGDRLPVALERQRPSEQPHARMPFACDPAFSPIVAPAAANVYRRCMA